jgi:hypothetical protein
MVQYRRGGEQGAAAAVDGHEIRPLAIVHTLKVFEYKAQPSGLPKSVIKLWRQVLSHLPAPALP